MWLLSTSRAELTFFPSPEDVPGGYAILSHVWLKGASTEDTFQSVQSHARFCTYTNTTNAKGPQPPLRTFGKLRAALPHVTQRRASPKPGGKAPVPPKPPSSPRDLVSPKLRNFLCLAEVHGYAWAWADTCCIDKTSSAELTEAISSMFRYYAFAEVCYVYLSDVSPGCNPTELYSEFGRSEWHTRGWTLQELLASKTVLFLSRDWTVLGDKYGLAPILEKITRVPQSVLRFEEDIADRSIAERMSWAARRRTTRVEDEAYCLFGLFGINMPTLYGEGRNAFFRLQEEILRTSIDTTLFAWGLSYIRNTHNLGDILRDQNEQPVHYLLASSPEDFRLSSGIVFHRLGRRRYDQRREILDSLTSSTAQEDPNTLPRFKFTPEGVQAYLPIIRIDADYIAANLSCTQARRPMWLILRRDKQDPHADSWTRFAFVVPQGSASDKSWSWECVYIRARPMFRAHPVHDPYSLLARLNADVSAPYRIKPSSLSFASTVGLQLCTAAGVRSPSSGHPVLVLVFKDEHFRYLLSLVIGRCQNRSPSTSTSPTEGPAEKSSWNEQDDGEHYASIVLHGDGDHPDLGDLSTLVGHACPDEHLSRWPDKTAAFHGTVTGLIRSRWQVSLVVSFRYSPLSTDGKMLEFHLYNWGVSVVPVSPPTAPIGSFPNPPLAS